MDTVLANAKAADRLETHPARPGVVGTVRLLMAELIETPTIVDAAGEPPKTIREFAGRVNTGEGAVSVAHMTSPPGWREPWQRPDFDEWTVVLGGVLHVEDTDMSFDVGPGQAVHAPAGARVRYSTPEGADYIAVCLPAFSPQSVHREAD